MPDRTPPRQNIPTRLRKSQAQRREETRFKLVQGAVELLKKKRYAGFRVADVTTMSGVSRGAQSHYFPMKDDLVIEALEFVFKETQANALAKITKAKAHPDQLLQALIADSKDFFLGDNFYLSLDLMMVGGEEPLGQAVQRLAQNYRVSVETAWREVFKESGYSASTADEVVSLTFCVVRGLSIRKIIGPDTARIPHMIKLWKQQATLLLESDLVRKNNKKQRKID